MGAALLEIRLGLADGSNLVYRQDDSVLAEKTLRRIEPERLFVQPTVVIGGDHHVSVFPSAQVVHVELRSELLPEWSFGTNFERLVLLDEETFQRRLKDVADVSRRELKVGAGEDILGYALLEMRGGFRYRIGIHAKALPTTVRASRLTRILEVPVLHVRRGTGSAFLVNLANAVSLRVYPGMPELPPHALEAHEVVEEMPESSV